MDAKLKGKELEGKELLSFNKIKSFVLEWKLMEAKSKAYKERYIGLSSNREEEEISEKLKAKISVCVAIKLQIMAFENLKYQGVAIQKAQEAKRQKKEQQSQRVFYFSSGGRADSTTENNAVCVVNQKIKEALDVVTAEVDK